ncbi:hypothetical protein [Sphaerisporangium dianthi]|uniref:Uncharacterized protein n=1 Tax=Sphaerisporangium dianthi TaxID=1436120 RepID=A0ABV9CVE3_9ACTN
MVVLDWALRGLILLLTGLGFVGMFMTLTSPPSMWGKQTKEEHRGGLYLLISVLGVPLALWLWIEFFVSCEGCG